MAESLDVIDRMLAKDGIALHSRPMQAAIELVRLCITKVDEGSGEKPPGKFPDYLTSKWFRIIFKNTEQWYRDRFADAMDAGRSRERDAVTLVRDTPYLVKVPTTTTEPSEPGQSFWLCYHDAVRSDEDVIAWVRHGPNFTALTSKDVKSARAVTEMVATKLRSIHVSLLEMEGKNTRLGELREAIMPNLERAARHLAAGAADEFRLAHWDMQMACELALKCLAQQRAGTFRETHDLFLLYDTMPEAFPPFARTELSTLPNWKKMADLRYGGGPAITTRQAFRAYRATLTIVDATLGALKRPYRIGKARFHLKRPPWMEGD